MRLGKNKITVIFVLVDGFCIEFNALTSKYALGN